MNDTANAGERDWVGRRQSYIVAWGLPGAALLLAIPLGRTAMAIVWTIALTWMGAACLINASRCGRTHCYLTGPFFLVMAVLSVLHGFDIVSLGDYGWLWLGLSLVVIGGGLLWLLPERIWGKFRTR